MSGYDNRPPYGEGPINWREEAKFVAFALAVLGLFSWGVWRALG